MMSWCDMRLLPIRRNRLQHFHYECIHTIIFLIPLISELATVSRITMRWMLIVDYHNLVRSCRIIVVGVNCNAIFFADTRWHLIKSTLSSCTHQPVRSLVIDVFVDCINETVVTRGDKNVDATKAASRFGNGCGK